MKGLLEVFPVDEEKGEAKISHCTFSSEKDPIFNMRILRDSGSYMFCIEDGEYVRLHINGEFMMSDTRMEKESNHEFCRNAHGRVLIAGLGLGLVLHNILDKEEVKEVVVIEKSQDVIDLVGPHYPSPKLKIICADINEWHPLYHEKFNCIYFDIWESACTDNLIEIRKLGFKFRKYVDGSDPDHYMNAWLKEYLKKRKRKESYAW